MRIRTITTGITLEQEISWPAVKAAAQFNQEAMKAFEKAGVEVQTTRVCTNPWEEYVKDTTPEGVLAIMRELDRFSESLDIDFFSTGYTSTPENISILPNIIKSTRRISFSAKVGDKETGIDMNNIYASARAIIRNSMETPDGLGNFLFCAWANCPPGIPFFPASYHVGEPSFALGMESGDLVMKAFKGQETLEGAAKNLEKVMVAYLEPLINISYELAREHDIEFKGIDV